MMDKGEALLGTFVVHQQLASAFKRWTSLPRCVFVGWRKYDGGSMKKIVPVTIALMATALIAALTIAGCGPSVSSAPSASSASYEQISAQQAKELMDADDSLVILDVRTQQEYEQAHIPGAILLPLDQVEERAQTVLPHKDQLILVYCRSGNRSKQASELLAAQGYVNVKEFGGINDWPFDVE